MSNSKLVNKAEAGDAAWFIPLSSMTGIAQGSFLKMINVIKHGGQVDVVARCDGKDYRWQCDGLKNARLYTRQPAPQGIPDIEGLIAEVEALKVPDDSSLVLPLGFDKLDVWNAALDEAAALLRNHQAAQVQTGSEPASQGTANPAGDGKLVRALRGVMLELWWCAMQLGLDWKNINWRKNSSVGRAYDQGLSSLDRAERELKGGGE